MYRVHFVNFGFSKYISDQHGSIEDVFAEMRRFGFESVAYRCVTPVQKSPPPPPVAGWRDGFEYVRVATFSPISGLRKEV